MPHAVDDSSREDTTSRVGDFNRPRVLAATLCEMRHHRGRPAEECVMRRAPDDLLLALPLAPPRCGLDS